jgi:hypothetical protein
MAKKESKRSSRKSPDKIWVLRRKNSNSWRSSSYGLFNKGEKFDDYEKLLKTISNSKSVVKIDTYKLESTSEESVGSELFENFIKVKEREQSLSVIMWKTLQVPIKTEITLILC